MKISYANNGNFKKTKIEKKWSKEGSKFVWAEWPKPLIRGPKPAHLLSCNTPVNQSLRERRETEDLRPQFLAKIGYTWTPRPTSTIPPHEKYPLQKIFSF